MSMKFEMTLSIAVDEEGVTLIGDSINQTRLTNPQ